MSEVSSLRILPSARPWRGRAAGLARALVLGLGLALLPPLGAAHAADGAEAARPASSSEAAHALSDLAIRDDGGRLIAGGVILILLGGLAGVTVVMWRDVGRRFGCQ